MMKSTLIKDLYGEIERLKAGNYLFCGSQLYLPALSNGLKMFPFSEVYAAREKVGVYIPKERYYQEESERKVLGYLSYPPLSAPAYPYPTPTPITPYSSIRRG